MILDQLNDPMPVPFRRYAVWIYSVTAYLLSWGGVWLIINPYGLPGRPEALNTVYVLTFVAMAVGPPLASIVATAAFDGLPGVNDLFSRLTRWSLPLRYYLIALLLVPATAAAVGLAASVFSPEYAPRLVTAANPAALLLFGIGVGLVAGWMEEIGWTGFALHRLLPSMGVWRTGMILGAVHGLWHLLASYWGEAASFGVLYPLYFLAMWILGLMALRLLIAWLYERTQSVVIGQIAHASYTGGLLILWPTATSALPVTLWAGAFSVTLLLVVGAVCWFGRRRPG